MISAEGNMNLYVDAGASSTLMATSTETVVPLLEDAVKDLQRKSNCREIADANIESDVVINSSLNQISQKFTLNERQDTAFKNCGKLSSGLIQEIIVKSGPRKSTANAHLRGRWNWKSKSF